MSKYTTGEVAKLCNVSVRTVQFYDDKKLLCPSELTEGGRRLYSDEDVRQLKIICYLRDLGFSIKNISQMLAEENCEDVIKCIVSQQKQDLQNEIEQKQRQLQQVENIDRSLQSNKQFSLKSIYGVASAMKNKNKLKKVYTRALALGIPLACYQIFSIVFWIVTGIWWPFAVWGGVAIVFGTVITKYYWKNVAYVCPECGHVFKPKFKEGFFAAHTLKTRKLTCPSCGKKSHCVEVHADELKKD